MIRIIYDIKNVSNTHGTKMVGRRWIMTPDGLACVDCQGLKSAKSENEEDDLQKLEEIEQELEDQQNKLEKEQQRLEEKMEKLHQNLKKKQEELDQESEDYEEADGSNEILLKRVINATYRISPTNFTRIRISYPG
ncbi:MAG: hypothetical protein JKX84_03585 [Flavobacteriales bacterium]|nr:hypothetical protein [Flavobacteriales bacterium]